MIQTLAVLIVVCVSYPGISTWVRAHLIPRDPARLFSADQKRILLARAGHRCQHLNLWLFRCRVTKGLQADHVMPWSRGGRTTVRNGQMLCRRHNASKSNRIPSVVYRWRVRSRSLSGG